MHWFRHLRQQRCCKNGSRPKLHRATNIRSVAPRSFFLFLFLTLAAWTQMRADEETRQVQEELRKRHLFFRDIDGRPSQEYALALKRYQQRQGFAQSGVADDVTLYSLGIGEPESPAEGKADLPDVPVLKSDAMLREPHSAAPVIPIQAQKTGATKAEIRDFLRRYFDACQSPNPDDELGFYADRVQYFDHGVVDKPYIRNELAVYVQRWPSRKYSLGDSLRVEHKANNTLAKIRVAFQVANPEQKRAAKGRTDDIFSLAKRGNSLEIVALKEARVRRPSRHRRCPPSFPAAVGRTINHAFRSIFH